MNLYGIENRSTIGKAIMVADYGKANVYKVEVEKIEWKNRK